jgi:hypothetical protein
MKETATVECCNHIYLRCVAGRGKSMRCRRCGQDFSEESGFNHLFAVIKTMNDEIEKLKAQARTGEVREAALNERVCILEIAGKGGSKAKR